MKVSVLHQTFGGLDEFEEVATVAVPNGNSAETALEYAYRWTNNIDGSWSIPNNSDYNPFVTVVKELHVANGRTYGLRSSMMGDVFVIDDKDFYICASFGFKKLDGPPSKRHS